jgi:hypothetical protein
MFYTVSSHKLAEEILEDPEEYLCFMLRRASDAPKFDIFCCPLAMRDPIAASLYREAFGWVPGKDASELMYNLRQLLPGNLSNEALRAALGARLLAAPDRRIVLHLTA